MFVWPSLELTDYERKYVRIYKTKDKPGVLNRIYKVVLNSQAQPNKNLPTIKLSGQIQIARRSRVYGITFSGNIDRWRLGITNASGTLYTAKTPRQQQDAVVTSLVPGSYYNALATGGLTPPYSSSAQPTDGIGFNFDVGQEFESLFQPFPLLIEPNWVLLPNETLIFNGTPIEMPVISDPGPPEVITSQPLVLVIGIHVWEFPIMGTSSAAIQEVI